MSVAEDSDEEMGVKEMKKDTVNKEMGVKELHEDNINTTENTEDEYLEVRTNTVPAFRFDDSMRPSMSLLHTQ